MQKITKRVKRNVKEQFKKRGWGLEWNGMEGKGQQANSDAILQYASCFRQLWLPEYVESWSKFAIGELKNI